MNPQPPAEQEAGAAGAHGGASAAGSFAPARWPTVAALLALCLALAAAGFAGVSSWQLRKALAAGEAKGGEERAALETALENTRSSAGDTAERVTALGGALDQERERVRGMADRLEALPERVDALERRVEASSGSSDARSEWLRAEAEYYLAVANAELALGGRWGTAVSALELADDRLRALSDPSLTEVRRLVADELQQLKGVRLPDLEGLTLGLGQLAQRVEELPLRRAGPVDRPSAAPIPDAQPGLGRLWLTVKRALGGIVSVERTGQPVAQALSAEDAVLARRQLALELEIARAAALDARPEAFASSLHNALTLLTRDFDTDSAAVAGARDLLLQLQGVDIAPSRPDIGESLKRLRLANRKD